MTTITKPLKSRIIATFIVIVIILIHTSCTKEIPITWVDTKNDIVVNSIYSLDKPFYFKFSSTSNISQDYNNIISDSLYFSLFEENILLLDTVFSGNELQTDIYPHPKSAYDVIIKNKSGAVVSTSDTIPSFIRINKTKLLKPAGIDEYGDEYAEAQITFSDPGAEKNYYEICVYNYNQEEIDKYWNLSTDIKYWDPVIQHEGDIDYTPSSYFFSDELFNGQEYTIKIQSPGGLGTNDKYGVILRSTSKNYYLYRKYFTRHINNQQLQGDFLDIVFMGEPQTMFTNIENGFGIFAGYIETSALLTE